jgi:probable F420-dependent oxidoreductase
MNLGVALPSYGNDGWRFPSNALRRYARRAEETGFSGLWIMEHLTRPPGRSYNRLDPLTTLASIAEATDRIAVGTSVLLLPLRNPVFAAHRAATIQHLSDDRLTLGLGIGWSEDEYAAAGVPFEERGPRFTEGLELVSRLFREDTVTFDGEFYSVEDFRLEPPAPRPPRILVGGGGVERDDERTVPRPVKERILQYADGWVASSRAPDVIEADWTEIADHLEENGRDPATLDRVGLNRAYVVPGVDSELAREKQRRVFGSWSDDEGAMEKYLTGSVDEIRGGITRYRDLGFDELVLDPVTHDPADAEDQLRSYEKHLGDFI